jgi:hypothetical protein
MQGDLGAARRLVDQLDGELAAAFAFMDIPSERLDRRLTGAAADRPSPCRRR